MPLSAVLQIGAPGSVHSIDIGVSFRADELTAIMLVMVTFIGTLIAIFAAGYMDGDPGYPRFFAEVSLFVFSMTLLVLGDNLILLYAGWEGVGLCSYLLIGFWFTKPSAADAARKAFLVTRIGDVGLMLGIFLIWVSCDYKLDYTSIFEKASAAAQFQGDVVRHLLPVVLQRRGQVGRSSRCTSGCRTRWKARRRS